MSTVIGYFESWERADRAVRDLIAAGAPRDDLNVIAHDDARRSATARGTVHAGDKDAGGAAGGATAGAVLGGALGVAVGLGALVIPGVGPILAAGPIVAALAGGAAGAAAGGVAGGLVGALVDAGVPKDKAEAYAEGIRRGGVLVSLRAPSPTEAQRAERILEDAGAVDVFERAESWRKEGWTGSSGSLG